MKTECLDEVLAFVIWEGWGADFTETWDFAERLFEANNNKVPDGASEFASNLHGMNPYPSNYEEDFTFELILERVKSRDFKLLYDENNVKLKS